MKNSKIKIFLNISLRIIIAVMLVIIGCCSLNFILVPPSFASTIETVMEDANRQTNNIDIVFFGSSRTYRGINSVGLTNNLNKNVFNIAYENANYYSTYHLLQEVIKNNNLETLFLEVSTTNFTRNETSEDKFIYRTLTKTNKSEFAEGIGLKYFNSKLFNFTNHLENFSNTRFVNNLKVRFSKDSELGDAINIYLSTYMGHGFLYSEREAIDSELTLPVTYFQNGVFWENSFASEKQLLYFEKIIETCNNNNIQLILFSPPYPYSVTEKNNESFSQFDAFIDGMLQEHNLQYFDFSKLKKVHINLTNELFYNANHCNGKGATDLQPIIKNIIEELENNTFIHSNWFYSNFTQMIEDYNN